jgi:hypothetical protein
VSLLLASACFAGAVLLGRYISRGGRKPNETEGARDAAGANGGGNASATNASASSASATDDWDQRAARGKNPFAVTQKASPRAKSAANTAPARDPFAGFPCRLGDVVMRSGRDEAWLAGAVLLDEATFQTDGASSDGARGVDAHSVAVLFVAPEAGADIHLYVRAEGGAPLWWMHALPDGEIAIGNEPPSSLEHGELRFERRRRLPLYAHRVGSGAPDLGNQVIVAEYSSGGYEQLLVIVTVPGSGGSGASHARAWRGVALEAGMYEVIPSGSATLES